MNRDCKKLNFVLSFPLQNIFHEITCSTCRPLHFSYCGSFLKLSFTCTK